MSCDRQFWQMLGYDLTRDFEAKNIMVTVSKRNGMGTAKSQDKVIHKNIRLWAYAQFWCKKLNRWHQGHSLLGHTRGYQVMSLHGIFWENIKASEKKWLVITHSGKWQVISLRGILRQKLKVTVAKRNGMEIVKKMDKIFHMNFKL